ncbi:hypothetical protein GWN91_08480 [Candidatus Saccharibacteria bacterium]|nr:hypothetical protein [Candidatus Saccharibacteria bacterium]
MLIKHPTDSLMYKYFVAKNLLDSRQHRKSLRKTKQLVEAIKAGKTSVNPNFKYLVYSLLGRNYHSINHLQKAEEAFARVIPDLDDMEDEFRRAWVYIHYNRYLRSAKKYDRAEEMLDRADDFDDEYSRIIIERERFILNKKRKTKDS